MTRVAVLSLFSLLFCAAGPALDGSAASILSFGAPIPYGTGDAFQIVLGDLDNDGDLDAVFSNMATDCAVWTNDGAGRFQDSYQRLGSAAHGIGVGDLDLDGDLDLFIARASTSMSSSVYLNDGAGRFVPTGQDLGDRSHSGNFVTLIDLEKDGDLDAAVYYAYRFSILYVNDGHARFAPLGTRIPGESVWGDIDADGDADAVSWGGEVGAGYVVRKNTGGVFATSSTVDAPTMIIGGNTTLVDVDNDGDLDLVSACGGFASADTPLTLLRNDGSGRFTYSPEPRFLTGTGRLSYGDFDGDGWIDLFIRGIASPALWGLNDGRGGFVDSELSWPARDMPGCPAVGDLDGDGDLDLFLASFATSPNEVLFNTSE